MFERSLSWFYNEMHHGKDPIDGVGCTVKNVIFPKVKSWQVIVYTPLKFTEAGKRFILLVHAVYLPQSKMSKEPNDINAAPKIKETLRLHKLAGNISFFRVLKKEEPFHVQWYGNDNHFMCNGTERIINWFTVMKKQGIQIAVAQSTIEFIRERKNGYSALHLASGFMKTVL